MELAVAVFRHIRAQKPAKVAKEFMKRVISLSLLVGGLSIVGFSLCQADSITFYSDRTAWETAVGEFWDVNLNDRDHNTLTPSSTPGVDVVFGARTPIYLPWPGVPYTESFSFDTGLNVVWGVGWHNYFGTGDPVVLSLPSGSGSLTGTFSQPNTWAFGFEVQPSANSLFTVTVGASSEQVSVAAGEIKFIGWVPGSESSSFGDFTLLNSNDSGFEIGNFVVPDGGATTPLLGIALVGLAAAGRLFRPYPAAA